MISLIVAGSEVTGQRPFNII